LDTLRDFSRSVWFNRLMITLPGLLIDFPFEIIGEVPDIPIRGIASDHRRVIEGGVFIAVKGYSVDGHEFIPDAIRRGAVAVVGSTPDLRLSVPYIQVENSRQALAYLAAAYYGFPARRLRMIGVTGTDGKTTTVNLIYQILVAAGIKAGMISTVNAVIGDQVLDTGFHVTTPDSLEIQRYLAMMVSAGLTHSVIETTSHGLAQYRVDGCEFDLGVLTNISHEHLNEHGSIENYRAAKARLFQSLMRTGERAGKALRVAVVNRDDHSFQFIEQVLADYPQIKMLTYGIEEKSDVMARSINWKAGTVQYKIEIGALILPIESRLFGLYNISNCLAAVAATMGGLGIDACYAQKAIFAFPGIPGRMEPIFLGQEYHAYVDFAHTPNALERVLKTLRDTYRGRIVAVFGSAGLRDQEKRRLMAESCAILADVSIITAEDPRTEPLDRILKEMAIAAINNGATINHSLYVIPDRRQAIRKAVQVAVKDDVVVVLGKGHEQSMCFGTTEYPWDDRTALRSAIADRLGIPGPEMPYLPTL
jgi:UDP-N-acetylmuramoyl-L-alanyl-D-glutamate--2,6-diaminopimelate ligase